MILKSGFTSVAPEFVIVTPVRLVWEEKVNASDALNCPLFLNCTVTVLVDVSHAKTLPLPPFKPATSDVLVLVVESIVWPTSISVPLLPVIANW